jgi:two-component system chemotaxis response regulator CheB
MPAGFTASFAKRLDQLGNVRAYEAVNGDRIEPGTALIAPGGFHMTVGQSGTVTLSDEPALHGVKPAADLLFASGAKHFGPRSFGIVLTGMGKDGAAGAVEIRKCGGTVLGESESSCVVYGMPKAAKEAGGVDSEFSIEDMAQALVANLSGGVKRAS